MKQLIIDSDREILCTGSIHIRSGYDWEKGWSSEEEKNAFVHEVTRIMKAEGFTKFKDMHLSTHIGKFYHQNGSNHYMSVSPYFITYFGKKDGFKALEQGLMTEKYGRMNTFDVLSVEPVKDVYDLAKEEVRAVYENNRAVIEDNIIECIKENPGIGKLEVLETVYEAIRFPNTGDKTEHGLSCWGTNEAGYEKTVEIFNDMLKDKVIELKGSELVVAPEIKKDKKISLKPKRLFEKDKEMEKNERVNVR